MVSCSWVDAYHNRVKKVLTQTMANAEVLLRFLAHSKNKNTPGPCLVRFLGPWENPHESKPHELSQKRMSEDFRIS